MTRRNAINSIKEILLHIGTEKTGTTAIQECLIQNRRELVKQNVLYPKALGQHHTSQWELMAAVHEEPWKNDFGRILNIESEQDQERFRNQLLKTLADEISRHKSVDRLIISCEHFHSRLTHTAQISKLKKLLLRFSDSVKIIIYFRRQDQVGLSFQSTRLKSSINIAKSNELNPLAAPAGYFSYDDLYLNWAGVFGEGAIVPRLYHRALEDKYGLVGDFAGVCGIVLPKRPTKYVNRSLNQKGFHFLRVLNDKFPIGAEGRNDPVRKTLIRVLETEYSGNYRPIDRTQILKWYEQFQPVNERLRELAFPEVKDPIFSLDFSDYPNEPVIDEPRYEDAVEIAFRLWSRRQSPHSVLSKFKALAGLFGR